MTVSTFEKTLWGRVSGVVVGSLLCTRLCIVGFPFVFLLFLLYCWSLYVYLCSV